MFDLIRSMRPRHWVKNVFVLAPLIFALRLDDPGAVGAALAAFTVFCALSSAVYLMNDIVDRKADALHPVKRDRPIAAGRVSVVAALLAALALAAAGAAGALALGPWFAILALTYVLINVGYSLALKQVVILDVMIVASGFLLRAGAGAAVLQVEMSNWLVLCTGLIALFLAVAKRRQEMEVAGAGDQRPILREYSLPLLDQMIGIVTASTLLAYSLYAFSDEVAEKLGTPWMGLTIPFVLFGIFRYLYLIHRHGQGENPTTLVMTDRPLLATMVLWGGVVLLVMYVL